MRRNQLILFPVTSSRSPLTSCLPPDLAPDKQAEISKPQTKRYSQPFFWQAYVRLPTQEIGKQSLWRASANRSTPSLEISRVKRRLSVSESYIQPAHSSFSSLLWHILSGIAIRLPFSAINPPLTWPNLLGPAGSTSPSTISTDYQCYRFVKAFLLNCPVINAQDQDRAVQVIDLLFSPNTYYVKLYGRCFLHILAR